MINLPKLIKYVKVTPIEMFAACGCVYVQFLSLGTSACCLVMKFLQGLYRGEGHRKFIPVRVCTPFMPTLISSHCICRAAVLGRHTETVPAMQHVAEHVFGLFNFLLCWGCRLCSSRLFPCKLKLCSWPVNLAPLALTWACDWGAVCTELGSVWWSCC